MQSGVFYLRRGSILFLKAAIFIIGVPIFTLGVLGLIMLIKNPVNPAYAHGLYPIVAGMYVSVIPFFIALYHSFKLLSYIDRNQAFTNLSVKALKVIKTCAMTNSGVYAIILPFVFIVAQLDDAPGLIIVGGIPIFGSILMAVFTGVLQRLLQEAIQKMV